MLNIQSNKALGASLGSTTVNSGAALQLQNIITVTNETLTLRGTGVASDGALRNISGNNTWTGNISLGSTARINSDADTLTLSGSISGSNTSLLVGGSGNTTTGNAMSLGSGGLTKDGSGTLTLGATGNNYTGATAVTGGTLRLNANDALPHGTALTVSSPATLDLNNNTATVASLGRQRQYSHRHRPAHRRATATTPPSPAP